MENILLVVLLILALTLIGIVLLQRSEGGGLGIGGGGGVVSNRSAATALGKLTWILGAVFMVISLVMTVLAAREGSNLSVIEGFETLESEETLPSLPSGDQLLPPQLETGDGTETPPRAD